MRERILNPTAASLLGFLHHGAASGWDLAAKAQKTIGEFWNVTRSQVYRELKLLEGEGHIVARGSGARRHGSISPSSST